MTTILSRREVLAAPPAAILGARSGAAASVFAAPTPVSCAVLDSRGEPLPVEKLQIFHICDSLMRPIPIEPQFAAGEVRFQPAQRPFRVALPLAVPGFGEVFVYADNRGRGHTRQSLAKGAALLLNREFAADRLATVRKLLDECRRAGLSISAAAQGRADDAEALLKKAEAASGGRAEVARWSMESLRESLWAGEMIVLERARQQIERQGPRPGFLFGAAAFGSSRYGKPYTERFEALFNFATVPVYRHMVEPVEGKRDYSRLSEALDWLGATNLVCKAHPLIFPNPGTPSWLRHKPIEQARQLHLDYVRDTVLKFRHRIHAWDVINEAHVQPDSDSIGAFSKEQNVELTVAACRAAREADPTCFRLVNSTGTWCEYYMARKPDPWQVSVYDYLHAVQDAKADFEAIGLQYYYAGRDLLETERDIETFKGFGKPIHITELQIASASREVAGQSDAVVLMKNGKLPWLSGVQHRPWHGGRHTEETQADWAEGIYTLCFSKPYIHAVTWWTVMDRAGSTGDLAGGGLLRGDGNPKESYTRLLSLLAKWRAMA